MIRALISLLSRPGWSSARPVRSPPGRAGPADARPDRHRRRRPSPAGRPRPGRPAAAAPPAPRRAGRAEGQRRRADRPADHLDRRGHRSGWPTSRPSSSGQGRAIETANAEFQEVDAKLKARQAELDTPARPGEPTEAIEAELKTLEKTRDLADQRRVLAADRPEDDHRAARDAREEAHAEQPGDEAAARRGADAGDGRRARRPGRDCPAPAAATAPGPGRVPVDGGPGPGPRRPGRPGPGGRPDRDGRRSRRGPGPVAAGRGPAGRGAGRLDPGDSRPGGPHRGAPPPRPTARPPASFGPDPNDPKLQQARAAGRRATPTPSSRPRRSSRRSPSGSPRSTTRSARRRSSATPARQKIDNAEATGTELETELQAKRFGGGTKPEEIRRPAGQDPRQRAAAAPGPAPSPASTATSSPGSRTSEPSSPRSTRSPSGGLDRPRQQLAQAESTLERLENPFTIENILDWLIRHGVKIVAIVLGMVMLRLGLARS